MELEIKLILYILLGAVAGMLYSLKRVLRLERLILEMDKKISRKLGLKHSGPTMKVVRKRITKKTIKKPKKKKVMKKAKKRRKKKR